MQEFKFGIGKLLQARPHIKYLPAFLSGMGKVWPKGSLLLVPYCASVNLGMPRYVQSSCIESILEEVKQEILSICDMAKFQNSTSSGSSYLADCRKVLP